MTLSVLVFAVSSMAVPIPASTSGITDPHTRGTALPTVSEDVEMPKAGALSLLLEKEVFTDAGCSSLLSNSVGKVCKGFGKKQKICNYPVG